MNQGLFITFEGGEGAGKTTLIESIEKALSSSKSVLKTREPGGCPLGEEIRKVLLERKESISPYAELSLFLASRTEHLFKVIYPALEEGKVVLCDRFNDSSIAYQGFARGLGFHKVHEICSLMCEGIEPHLTIYLDLDPTIGLKRASQTGEKDRMESEALFFHQKVRDGFLEIHKKFPKRFHMIDATLPPQKVFEEAMHLIEAVL